MSGIRVNNRSWRSFAAGELLVVLAGCTATPGSGCSPDAGPSSTTSPGSTTTEPTSTSTTAPDPTTTTAPGPSSTSTTTSTTVPGGGGEVVPASDVSVGDCVSPVGDDLMVASVEVVECDEPHQAEVYDQFSVPDGELADDPATPGYPGGAELTWYAQDECQRRFDDAMGETYWNSPYDIRVVSPSFSTWDLGDRTITCLVIGSSGTDLVGSVLA